MAKKKANRGKGKALGDVADYRHEGATRVNIPPAKIAAEGAIPRVSDVRCDYSPRRPPTLRFDQHGESDKLFDLLEQARQRVLTDEEAKTLAEALRTHEPWLEWFGEARGEIV
jgi:adenine-specific DNA-methyltransferase